MTLKTHEFSTEVEQVRVPFGGRPTKWAWRSLLGDKVITSGELPCEWPEPMVARPHPASEAWPHTEEEAHAHALQRAVRAMRPPDTGWWVMQHDPTPVVDQCAESQPRPGRGIVIPAALIAGAISVGVLVDSIIRVVG